MGSNEGALGRRHERGFTLIELLVVVAIIGIVSAMAMLTVREMIYRATASAIVGDWKVFQTAAEQYQADQGRYPDDRSSYSEPPELRDYLNGKIDWNQGTFGYDWENWSGSPNPDQSGTGVDIGFSVVTSDPRLVEALRGVYKGDLRATIANHYTFVMVPEP